MANGSKIEWTEATWNPTTGCTKISEGCKNCYAERLSKRLKRMRLEKYKNGFKFTHHEDNLDLPKKWKKPRRIFVNSMSDLFHEEMDLTFVARCFKTMNEANRHIYQILTKRPEKMLQYSIMHEEYFGKQIESHIWLGTSVENRRCTKRIIILQKVNVPIKFVSFEPLLGSIGDVDLTGIQWAIIGGESGPNYRPVKEEWVRELINTCHDQDVKVFFKQWGGFRPQSNGRMIDGKTYDEYPSAPKKRIRVAPLVR